MSGTSKGFTFIELIVAIVILGIMATFIVPPFFRQPEPPIETFAYALNSLIRTGILDAIETERVHRIYFDFKKEKVTLETATKQNVDANATTATYLPVTAVASNTVIDLPARDVLQFSQFYIGSVEERGKLDYIYFFIGADGSVQDVTIIVTDLEHKITKTLMINPFSGQLVLYDGIKKP